MSREEAADLGFADGDAAREPRLLAEVGSEQWLVYAYSYQSGAWTRERREARSAASRLLVGYPELIAGAASSAGLIAGADDDPVADMRAAMESMR